MFLRSALACWNLEAAAAAAASCLAKYEGSFPIFASAASFATGAGLRSAASSFWREAMARFILFTPSWGSSFSFALLCLCVCVCVRAREYESGHKGRQKTFPQRSVQRLLIRTEIYMSVGM